MTGARRKKRAQPRTVRVERSSLRIVDIVADGGLAIAGVAFGRMLPLFIVDTSERPDVTEVLRVHKYIDSGDAEPEWGYLPDEGAVSLSLNFTRPVEARLTLYLPVQKYGGMIDQIVETKTVLTGN